MPTQPPRTSWTLSLFAFALLLSTGAASAVPCTQSGLLNALTAANVSGGTITFDCQDTTILMTTGLGDIRSNVVIDGEDRNITLQFTTDFTGCQPSNNGIGAPAIGRMRGSGSVVRNLRFVDFLESLQIDGPNNTVENNTFLAHLCSDDAVSTISSAALNIMVRNNHMEGYLDKAFQASYGGGVIEGNTFLDTQQPIRMPYDNSAGEPFYILNNLITTSGDVNKCTGVRVDGTYVILFEGNTHSCKRGIRISGNTEIVLRNNTIEGNEKTGVLLGGNAVASLEGNRIRNNGYGVGSEPSGGVVVWENATADLGGGTLTIGGETWRSRGNNVLQGNGFANVRDLRPGVLVEAEDNCWDGQTESTVQTDVEGDVDVTSFSHSGKMEVCDGVDNDCNGIIDDFCETPPEPRAAVCGQHAHFVWTKSGPGNQSADILYRRCDFDGNCDPIRTVVGAPTDESRPDIACDGDLVFIAWEDTRRGNHDIFYRRSADGGSSFDPIAALVSPPSDEHNPAVAVSGNLVVAVWEDERAGDSHIGFARSTDGGVSFEPMSFVVASPTDERNPDIALSGLHTVVVWEDTRRGNRNVAFRHSGDGGMTWDPLAFLVSTTTNESMPSVAMDGSTALVAWTDERRFRDDLFFRRSTDSGASFPTLGTLVGTIADDRGAAVALSGSDALVAWIDNRNSDDNISIRRSGSSGTTWGGIGRLASPPSDEEDVACDLEAGHGACVWSDGRGGPLRPLARFSTDGGQSWPIVLWLD